MKRLQERNNKGSLHVSRSIIAVLVTLLATLAMVVPLGLSALSANQANAIDGQDETANRRPLLYTMLAYNDKNDSYQDELRMDFILRVAHGEFKPDCVKTGSADTNGSCNLSFIYQYNGTRNPAHYRRVKYLNTIASDDTSSGAEQWAKNQDEFFTVHKVINSGLYDFLVVSIEGDMDLLNDAGDIKNYLPKAEVAPYFQAGGHVEPLTVYAIVGQQKDALSCNGGSWAYGTNDCDHFDPNTMSNLQDRSANIMDDLAKQGKSMKLYMGDCYDASSDSKSPDLRCSGPYSWIGWDNNPELYLSHQSNWGLVTDYGLPADSSHGIKAVGPGVAPPRSFFVYWENPRGGNIGKGICSETTSYYYQWVGLKDSQWVPVDDLTPEPILVEGQKPSPNTLTTTNGTQGTADSYSAFNLPKKPNNSNEMFATDKNGQPMPAQNADGSIDFKKAKEDQDLDGYFKMVTWPVTKNLNDTGTDNNCNVNPEVYNPMRKGLAGITDDMDASQKSQNLDSGWTINTAFYKYDVPRPDDPTITKIENGADGALDASGSVYTGKLDPVVSGECTPSKNSAHPNVVTLYGEDPSKPFNDGQGANNDDLVKSADTWGFKLGEAECKADTGSKQGGSWQIQDTNKQYPSPDPGNKFDGYRRYHAWVTETTSGFGLTSFFSNIGTAYFVSGENVPDASKFSVTVPHTVNGSLPSNVVVTFKGEVSPVYTAWSSGGLGMTDSRMAVSMKQNAASDWTPLLTTPANTFQRDAAVGTAPSVADSASGLTLNLTKTAASTWSWSLNIPADKFTGYNGDDETQTYTFHVEMINPMNIHSDPASIERKIDMTPTTLTIDRHDVFQVAGRAYKYVNGNTKVPETKGTLVHITWPGKTNSSTDVAVGDQGSWQATPPEGVNQGEFSAQVLSDDAEGPDAQGRFIGGNQSASVSHELDFRPSTSSLPLTGGWPLSVLRILLLIALGLVGFVACLRNKQESRH
ncbi:Uncharacterized protein JF69_02880 [Bifidobacterium kimbladii]|uniref:Uncharacterized protein n=1 Tax=Bifidobacterium asteroides TaxID=1684 RepID=A0A0F4L1Q0_9BIFI|nr:Uncharacterized protein JF69_02880 [Bifidobacterium asteroides]